MIACIEAKRAGLFKREHWLPNILAGVIVGIVALPLAMAFAIASGAKPEQGIYTAIVAGVVSTLLGGSRLQISGPTGAFIVILAGITAKYGITGLQIATLLAGLMLLIMGLLRFGSVIRFIPEPVVVGFTSGIAVIIWVGQWKDFFGLPDLIATHHFHEKLWALMLALPNLQPNAVMLGVLGLVILLMAPKWFSKIPLLHRVPSPLIAMVSITALQAVMQLDGVATIGSAFGGIPAGLPHFVWLPMQISDVIPLIGPAFTIALLGAIESLLSSVVADNMTGSHHDSNQELIGQGLANIISPLLGGFATTGAIARTATNIRNGATSPLSGIVHALTLVFVLLFLAPYAAHIPLCALSAILFVVAYNMSDLPKCWYMVKTAPKADVAVLVTTFLLTVFVDLVVAVNIGVVLAAMLFMKRMAESVKIQHLKPTVDFLQQYPNLNVEKLVLFSIEGPLFFGVAEELVRKVEALDKRDKTLVIRMLNVPVLDSTGIQAIWQIVDQCKAQNTQLMLVDLRENIHAKIMRAGISEVIGQEHVLRILGN